MCCAKSLASIFHVPPQDKLIIVQAELDCSFNRNLYCDANMYFYVKVSFFLASAVCEEDDADITIYLSVAQSFPLL